MKAPSTDSDPPRRLLRDSERRALVFLSRPLAKCDPVAIRLPQWPGLHTGSVAIGAHRDVPAACHCLTCPAIVKSGQVRYTCG